MLRDVLIVLGFIVFQINCGNIPSYIHICKRNDPAVAKCINESIEIIRPRLRGGIKELGVPALEHLKIQDIDIGQGSPNFKAILKDIDVEGASDFVLNKLKINVPTLTFRIHVTLPLLRLSGTFDVDTKILTVPFKGEGKFYANATYCIGTGVLKGSLKEVNGAQHVEFSQLNLKLQIADYNIKLETAKVADATLVQAANDVLNQNRQEFLRIATPFIETRVSDTIMQIANDIVKNFSFDEVFPEN
ncbi:hypothetical protein FQA39_LY11342 [Lamprigera yunnana]|nr:hypothetical protein FQA39_LY11342 [Lamprigera yunnana]